MIFRDTIGVVRAGSIPGPDGTPIESWKPADVTVTAYAGEFQPLSSTESVAAQQRTESTHRAFLPAGANVLVTDRLRFGGVDYAVDGEPERWRIRGRDHHVEVFVFRVQGG